MEDGKGIRTLLAKARRAEVRYEEAIMSDKPSRRAQALGHWEEAKLAYAEADARGWKPRRTKGPRDE